MDENPLEDSKNISGSSKRPTMKGEKQWKTVEYVTTTVKRPPQTKAEKGKHIRKTSEKQKRELISYFEERPNYVHIVAGAVGDNNMKTRIWDEVTKLLNGLSGGVQKSPAKWSKSWADMKVYAKARAKLAIQGNAPPNSKKPSDLDRRILKVISQEELLDDWDRAISEEGNGSSRQPILEHDYQVSGYDGEIVEEEFTVEEHENGQQHVIVKDLRDVMKQLKQENEENPVDALEFYIDEEDIEEVGESDEQDHEVVEHILSPPPKRQKVQVLKEDPPRVIEFEERAENPMADAIMTLADALNNVAGALRAAADTIKLLQTS